MKVFLADDHPIFRKGLTRAFDSAEGLELIGTASDGEEALAMLVDNPPDIAVLDIGMPKLDGIEVLEKMRAAGLTTKVIFLTGSEHDAVVYKAMQQGARGYVLKTIDWDDLMDIVRRVGNGETVIAPEIVSLLAGHIEGQGNKRPPSLSQRELEVLKLLAEGYSQAEIAQDLGIEFTTVRSHLRNLYRKLGVKGQAQAVAEGMRHDLIK